MRPVLALAVLQSALLTACLPPEPVVAPEATTFEAPSLPVEPNELVLEVREAVQELAQDLNAPEPTPEISTETKDRDFNACAVELITRWEVGSPKMYTRKYQGVYFAGGQSGPTWGIGYDGGHQTRLDISKDWAAHEAKSSLVNTSGVIGSKAKAGIGQWAGVRTPYLYAATVFAQVSLPNYTAATRRAFGPGFVSLPTGARCSLISLVYNRGGQTTGERRREYRTIRDVCIPRNDVQCIATELRSMQRLWPETPGLQARRADEARVAIL